MGRRPRRHARGPFLLIVVDTSVWIGHLRELDTPAVHCLRRTFGQERIVVGDIVLLEILQGVRTDLDAVLIERLLRAYDVCPMLDLACAIQAAKNYRFLRQRGITIRKTADMVIGTFCIDRSLPLLHDDRDFDHMERHLGLQVVRP